MVEELREPGSFLWSWVYLARPAQSTKGGAHLAVTLV